MEPKNPSEEKEELMKLKQYWRETHFVEFMDMLKNLNVNEFAPPKWLDNAESPFKWLQSLEPAKMSKWCDLEKKLDDYSNQQECYSFEKYNVLLVVAFFNVLMRDNEGAYKHLERLSSELLTMAGNDNDHMYSRIGPAFEHVLSATKAHLAFLEDPQKTEEHYGELIPKSLADAPAEVRAGVEAIKARFYLSCTSDNSLPINHMTKALSLDPYFAPWIYWMGKILRKQRRDVKEAEPTCELKHFELAVEMNRDPKYLAYLAQAYREKSNSLYKQNCSKIGYHGSEVAKEVEDLNNKSLQLYKECWGMKQDSAALCRRLGNGFMSLPRYLANYNLAKELLYKALELSTNPLTYHLLGIFYSKFEQDDQKAKEFLKKAADHGMIFGFDDLIRLKYLADPFYDPYEDLKIVEEAVKYSHSNLNVVNCELGWYFLFFKNDLCKAMEYFLKVIEEDEDSVYLKKFSTITFFVYKKVNIYSVLKKEVLRFKEEKRENKASHHFLEVFLNKVESRPDLIGDDDDDDFSTMQNEVKMNLRSNRRWRLDCPGLSGSDGFVGNCFPGGKYTEYRQQQLKDLTELLEKQNTAMGPINNYREKEVIEKHVNWRSENKELNANREKNYNIKPPTQTISKVNCNFQNWRLECKAPDKPVVYKKS